MNTPLPRPLRRASWATASAAAVSLLAACAPAPAPAPAVPAVFVNAVRNDHGSTVRVLSGSLRARVESDLAFRTGGLVLWRGVELGQAVRAGEVLGRLDTADHQLALQAAQDQQRAAEVDATQAASDASRFQRLLADGSVGAADAERQQARADAAAARLAQARQQVELARNRTGYGALKAPFDGVVTALRFERGQTVAEGQPVLSLARPGELEVQVDVPESMVAGLRDWQATARWGTDADAPALALRLREVAASASPVGRTYRARYALGPHPPALGLRLGMTAELRLQQPGRTPSAALPVSALLMTGDRPAAPTTTAVWLVDARTGALQRQPVQLLSLSTDHARVAGLADGALVVTVGAQTLDAGLKVRPVPRKLPADVQRVAMP